MVLISICTAGEHWLMQHHYYLALCPHQMLPKQPDIASCTCCNGDSQGDARGKNRSVAIPLRNGGSKLLSPLPVAAKRTQKLDLPPQRAGFEYKGSINPQQRKENIALGTIYPAKEGQKRQVSVI